MKILYILKIPLSTRLHEWGVSLLRGPPLEQLPAKKNKYSVILSFKHDRQNKVSNR